MELPIETVSGPNNSSTLDNDTTMVLESNEIDISSNNINKEETSKEYKVSDNDVQLLQKQIEVDEDKAKELLTKYKGDCVEALMELYDTNYVPPPTTGLASSSTKTLELNGILQEQHQDNIKTTPVKYPVIENILNPEPEFLEKFKTPYTYLVVSLLLENNSITKFKKYGTLPEIIKEKVVDILKNLIYKKGENTDLTKLKDIQNFMKLDTLLSKLKDSHLNIYPLQGNSKELLDKWDMTNAGLVLFKNQIISKELFLSSYPEYQYIINNNATELAQQNSVIDNEHIIIGHCSIINPCY